MRDLDKNVAASSGSRRLKYPFKGKVREPRVRGEIALLVLGALACFLFWWFAVRWLG